MSLCNLKKEPKCAVLIAILIKEWCKIDEQNNKQLEQIIADTIEPKLKESFNRGIMAGYDAAINVVYEHCKSMTSANKIKKYLKSKFDESKNRVENMTNKTE